MTAVVRAVSDHAPSMRALLEASAAAGAPAEPCTVRARLVGTTLLLLRARGADAAAPWLAAIARHAPRAQVIVLLPARVGETPSSPQIVAVVREGRHVLRTLVDVCRLALRRRGGVETGGADSTPRDPELLVAAVRGLGHEVANPAAAIATNLEVLRGDVERIGELSPGARAAALREAVPDWQSAVAESLEACRRLVGLVRQVNGLVLDPDPKPSELDPGVQAASRLLARAFRPRGRLVARGGAPGVRVPLDGSRVLRLVGDVVLRLTHALDARDAPPVRLLVLTRRVGARAELAFEITSEAGSPVEASISVEEATLVARRAAPAATVTRDERALRIELPIAP